MSEPKKETKKTAISSGNAELDGKMGGGLPVGSLALIEGSSGAGKSVLSQQIMYGALQDGYRASVFTTENTVKSMISQMQSIDMDVFDFLLLGKFRVYPVELSKLGRGAAFALIAAMKQERGDSLPFQSGAAGRRKHAQDILVVDSLTSAIGHATGEKQIISFFEECKRMCATGTTIIVTLHSQAVSGDLISPIRSMCDAHLNLRSEQDGQRLVKTLEVAKIRGAASGTGAIVGFDVEPGWGMRVIPISKARG